MTFILTVAFGWAMVYLKRNDGQPFAVKLMAMLFVSNLSYLICRCCYPVAASVITTRATYNALHPDNQLEGGSVGFYTLAAISYSCFVIQQFMFDIATWLMAHNYFICSAKLKNVGKANHRQTEIEQ